MFDDPVAVMVAHLNASLPPDVRASGRVPNPRHVRFVRCVLTGADRFTPVHRDARVTLECWAPTDAEADRLAAAVEDLVDGMGDAWNSVPQGSPGWPGGPHQSPDPDSGTPRVVMTANLRQRSRP